MPSARWSVLALMVLLAGCSRGAAGNDAALSGSYEISGTRILPSGQSVPRIFRIAIVSMDGSRVIYDVTRGDLARALPARDTAFMSGDAYAATWRGAGQFSYALRFVADSCIASDLNAAGDATSWVSCSISPVRP